MKTRTFNIIRKLVYEKCGIYLSESKMSLVTSRLQKRLRAHSLESYEEYLEVLEKDLNGEELVEFLNIISTNTTYFFREPVHFGYYSEILSRFISSGQKRIRVWCAASSTGEEPYTLAMCYKGRMAEDESVDFKILATDISTNVLNTALSGIYRKDRLKDIPGDIRFKYFNRLDGHSDEYQADSSLRKLITFKRLNLAHPPYPMRGPLDVIFCRNVMIYFDNAVKQRLVDEAYRLLKPGGYFFVGHSESISGIKTDFKLVKPAVYIKK